MNINNANGFLQRHDLMLPRIIDTASGREESIYIHPPKARLHNRSMQVFSNAFSK